MHPERSYVRALSPGRWDGTNDFERRYNEVAQPFDWTFTRSDLADLLDRLDERQHDPPLALAA